jgi:hypothetical protein
MLTTCLNHKWESHNARKDMNPVESTSPAAAAMLTATAKKSAKQLQPQQQKQEQPQQQRQEQPIKSQSSRQPLHIIVITQFWFTVFENDITVRPEE